MSPRNLDSDFATAIAEKKETVFQRGAVRCACDVYSAIGSTETGVFNENHRAMRSNSIVANGLRHGRANRGAGDPNSFTSANKCGF